MLRLMSWETARLSSTKSRLGNSMWPYHVKRSRDCFCHILAKFCNNGDAHLVQSKRFSPGTPDSGSNRLCNCSEVKTPTALKLELLASANESVNFTTITISYLFSKIRSTTWPIDIVVVTQGGGLLIIVESCAFNCMSNASQWTVHNSQSLSIIKFKVQSIACLTSHHF